MGILEEFKRLTKPYPDEQTDAFEDFSNFTSRETKPRPAVDVSKGDKVVSIHTTTQLQVVVVQPEHFDGASDIADHLLERRSVVLNLEKANKEAKRRLVDFLSGVVYAHHGKIKPIARDTYLLTPASIDIMGGDLIGELENNGLYI
ncbi:MAG: cell division protein SepF [Oscillospiraceae bacterium]|nr:cell division protein SepF [Oscillospiraceae bacterium]